MQEIIIEEKLTDVKLKSYAYPDQYIEHGEVVQLEEKYGVDEKQIREEFYKSIENKETVAL